MNSGPEPWAVIAGVLLLVSACSFQVAQRGRCKDRGGVYLWRAFTCVKVEAVLDD